MARDEIELLSVLTEVISLKGALKIVQANQNKFIKDGDSRLLNARMPVGHGGSHAQGAADPIPPDEHTHRRKEITDFFETPFWPDIADKPERFPPTQHAASHRADGDDPLVVDWKDIRNRPKPPRPQPTVYMTAPGPAAAGGIASSPPVGGKRIQNMYWNPATQEIVTVIEE